MLSHPPEHSEWLARQVGVFYQRHILCPAEGNANILTKGAQGLRDVSDLGILS